MSVENQKRELPVIQELYKDTDLAIQENALNVLLNQQPNSNWLVKHPTIKKQVKDSKGQLVWEAIDYMPINRIEWLLTRIFLKWRVEVKAVQLIANSVQLTIRLHYKNPIDGEWDWQDGVGAVPLQTDKNAGAIDFNNMKSNSVMMATPAAKSFAVKDAADEIGRLFGRDLNRTDINSYTDSLNKDADKLEVIQMRDRLSKAISLCKDKALVKTIIDESLEAEDLGTNTVDFYNRMLTKLDGGDK